MVEPVAVYVHIPFCTSKCGYCDFSSFALTGPIIERTVSAIVAEVRSSPWAGRKAKTVFFGGGTPSFLSSDQLGRILAAVVEAHPPLPDAEITSEANPGTTSPDKLAAMRECGFNRMSIGAQSFVGSDLVALGRTHRPDDIHSSVAGARSAGFDNLSLDLMYGLPGQTIEKWENNLHDALALHPQHLSLYCLTIEPGTPFHSRRAQGALILPGEDVQVEMHDLAIETLADAGLPQYEISNFARPGFECRHNLCYWHGEEYLAYGPGAVGAVRSAGPHEQRTRYRNHGRPEAYCDAVEQGLSLWEESEALDCATLRTERIMLGLRLNEGVDPVTLDLDLDAVARLLARGWIEQSNGRVMLSATGRHFCSDVAAELI